MFKKKSVSIFALPLLLWGCATPVAPPVSQNAMCASKKEHAFVGEILAIEIACKQVFPDMVPSIDQKLKPFTVAHANCFAEFDRPGDTKIKIQMAAGYNTGLVTRKNCVPTLDEILKQGTLLLEQP